MKYFSASQQWVLVVVALFLLGILFLKFYDHSLPTPPGEAVTEIVVEVLGEVRRPGIYLFQSPPNLGEAIERAGGFKETAQFDATLSSMMLETGTLLTVTGESSRTHPSPPSSSLLPLEEREKSEGPSRKEQRQGSMKGKIKVRLGRMAANKLLVFSIPLDLNDVSCEDLCLIPGVAESLAGEIIAYRERRKGFRTVEELRNIRGIGEKKYETIKKLFAVTR